MEQPAMAAAEYGAFGGGVDVFGHIDDLDHIDEFLNFPNEGDDDADGGEFFPRQIDDGLRVADDAGGAPMTGGSAVAVGRHEESKFGLHSVVPMDTQCDDAEEAQLEWLSNFFDDSADTFSLDFLTTSAATAAAAAAIDSKSAVGLKDDAFFRTRSPVSVLDPTLHSLSSSTITAATASSSPSTSSSSGGGCSRVASAAAPIILTIPARARSKRPRPATSISFVPPPEPPPETESFGESHPIPLSWEGMEASMATVTKKMTKKKKYKKKNIDPLGEEEDGGQVPGVITSPAVATAVRKCMHCEITKTPQWRAGPTGPKTLCNACGVRYKSGRLFPEYRPAASPTFLATVHSNSHKKVVEIRIKKAPAGLRSPTESAAAKNCDLMEYIRKRA